MDDLDVYNSILNEDTTQGASFLEYKKKYGANSSNNHELLNETSGPGLGSIMEGLDSLPAYKPDIQTQLSADEAAFNILLVQYSTAYTTYIANLNTGKASSADNSGNLLQVNNLYSQLITKANAIKTGLSQLNLPDYNNRLSQTARDKQAAINTAIQQFQAKQETISNIKAQYDSDSADGALETTGLTMDSHYIHYLVYFFIGIVLLVFIFNIAMKPDADVTKSIFFLVALFAVYIISRRAINN